MSYNLAFMILAFFVILPLNHLATVADEKKSYKNFKLHLVQGDPEDITKLLHGVYYAINANNYIIMYYRVNESSCYFLVPPAYEEQFDGFIPGKNLTDQIVVDDYAVYIKSEQATPGTKFSWTAYHDIDQIFAYVRNVSEHKQNIARVVKGGRSYEGRDILGLNINTGAKGKPAFYIEAGIHAREWIVPAAVTYFINQLLTSKDSKISALTDQFEWHIFPCINPDGYHYSYTTDRFWRKNRSKSPSGCHGVDLNRNWDTENWLAYSASNDSCDYLLYAGPKPFSEPETLSMSQYVSKITNLQAFVSVHSDSQMLLIPYSGSDEHVDNYDDLVKIGKSSLEYATRVNGAHFLGPAPAGEIDYKASGESIDWAKRSLKVPLAFEYELRGVLFDWPPSKIYQQGDELTQMMLGLVTEAKQLGYFKTPNSQSEKTWSVVNKTLNSMEDRTPKSEAENTPLRTDLR